MQILFWEKHPKCSDEWRLMLRLPRKRPRPVATVWENGTWHTWDHRGIGGWNDCCATVAYAKHQASAAAVMQGFI